MEWFGWQILTYYENITFLPTCYWLRNRKTDQRNKIINYETHSLCVENSLTWVSIANRLALQIDWKKDEPLNPSWVFGYPYGNLSFPHSIYQNPFKQITGLKMKCSVSRRNLPWLWKELITYEMSSHLLKLNITSKSTTYEGKTGQQLWECIYTTQN